MKNSAKRLLVVYYNYDPPEKMRLAIQHHLRGLEQGTNTHQIVYHNTYSVPYWEVGAEPEAAPLSIQGIKFDAVILHNTFLCLRWTGWYFNKLKQHFDWVRRIEAPKIAIPQDEGDHAGLLDEWLFEWGVQSVLTVHHDSTNRSPLYPRLRRNARFYRCLPGYIDERSAKRIHAKLIQPTERSLDIVYRAAHLPYWFGSAGQRKHRVADSVVTHANKAGLRCNISTKERDAILGDEWLNFLASGRATIGCEGGSSVLDWCGEIRAKIQALLAAEPNLSFEAVSGRMPAGWDKYRFLTITPRHFEAIITKTCQVLVEGDYRGILRPDKHYIPIKADFSNIDEALEKLRDNDLVQEIVEQAYSDVYLSQRFTYRAFAELIETALDDLYESNNYNGGSVMSHEDQAWLALEQQLIAERHNGMLLRANAQEAAVQSAHLEEQLKSVEERSQNWQMLYEQTQEQLIMERARLDELTQNPLVMLALGVRRRKTAAILICGFLALWTLMIVVLTAIW
jgi:hypothetical protein